MRNALILAIAMVARSSGAAKTHYASEWCASVVAQNETNYTLRFYDVINLIRKKYIATDDRIRLL